MTSMASPCISVCRMDPESGLCEGCLRNIDEIASWGSLSEDARRKVLAALKTRRVSPKSAQQPRPRELCEAASHAAWPAALRFIQRDWLSSNSVLVLDAQKGATLFDSGYVKHARHSREQITHMLEGMRLSRLINTHLHSDHCGANALLQQSFGCEIWIPSGSWQAAIDWDEDALIYSATGQRCQRFLPQKSLEPGERIQTAGLTWEVHAAPGHDPKSLVFFEASERLLISADVLWAEGFGVIFPELEGESGFDEQEAMLDLIEFMQPRWVFPGHGPAFSDLDQALASARKRLSAMRSDPGKHARHALKVLVKFLMLDLEWAEVDAFHAHLGRARLLKDCAKRMNMDPDQALSWVIDDLIAQEQLRREGSVLINHQRKAA